MTRLARLDDGPARLLSVTAFTDIPDNGQSEITLKFDKPVHFKVGWEGTGNIIFNTSGAETNSSVVNYFNGNTWVVFDVLGVVIDGENFELDTQYGDLFEEQVTPFFGPLSVL